MNTNISLGLRCPWTPSKGGRCPRIMGNHARGDCVALLVGDVVRRLAPNESFELGLMRLSDSGALDGVAQVELLTHDEAQQLDPLPA